MVGPTVWPSINYIRWSTLGWVRVWKRVEKGFRKVCNSPRMLHPLSEVLLVSKDLPQPFLEPFFDPYSTLTQTLIQPRVHHLLTFHFLLTLTNLAYGLGVQGVWSSLSLRKVRLSRLWTEGNCLCTASLCAIQLYGNHSLLFWWLYFHCYFVLLTILHIFSIIIQF